LAYLFQNYEKAIFQQIKHLAFSGLGAMLQNYLKIAYRNLFKNKVYSTINILGLATGMAVAMLIGLWIYDELSYNKSFDNYDKLGQLQMYQTFNDQRGPQTAIPLPVKKELQKFPDFKEIALCSWNFEHILANGENKFIKNGMYAEPEFTKMMSLKMVKGVQNGLKEVNVIMLSESLAKSLFGDADPIGKTLKVDNKTNLNVTGVYQDFQSNSEFAEVSHLLSWNYYLAEQSWVKNALTQWGNNSWQCFVQFNQNADAETVHPKIKDIVLKNTDNDGKTAKPELFIHPMSKWHLYSGVEDGKMTGGRIKFVWLFGIIGAFVLLLACINFMNLSTARSEKRAKEVGIRKAVGSVRSQLIGQFLSESLLTVFIAFIISILLVTLSLSWFSDISSKKISMPWTNLYFWLIGFVFILITGLLSGSYPALYLSSFDPIRVLKGTFRVGRFASIPRKVLVVVQFTVSVTLIIGTIIVYRQIQFAKNRPIGYDRNGLIYIQMNSPELQNANYETLRNELINTGVVENMCKSNSPVTQVWSNSIGFDWEGKDPNAQPLFSQVSVSHDYVKTVGMKIKEGRDFSRTFKTDTAAVIINESAAKIIGLKNPIGKFIKWNDDNKTPTQIIGISKDMITESPYSPTRPAFYFINNGWYSIYTVRLKTSVSATAALEKVGAVFKRINPGSPFEYTFVDEDFGKKFASEERIGTLATFFAILAVFISCLGLFGLASFVAEQRTKEIGVRKVLGASVFNLWQLLSKDFVYLVLISCLVSIPIAYFYLDGWLEKYEYRTQISWWIFALAALGALLITLLTVSYQAIKAALMNPVKSLKTE
jgi:putative ABC transport system permease protein